MANSIRKTVTLAKLQVMTRALYRDDIEKFAQLKKLLETIEKIDEPLSQCFLDLIDDIIQK
ncbi:MAG: hypothetical protein U9N54_06240 [candidate division Zixibacteria bacterium]|nr:hypothetical protein [candidate division Zixibacteria bacterium]